MSAVAETRLRAAARPAGAALALALAGALLLSACSKRDGGSEAGGGAAAPGSTVHTPLVIDIRQVGEVYDPTSVLPSEISAVAFNVYDWLFDRHFDGSVKPGLAETWTVSPDAKEVTITLRQGVTFHDGSPLTADDVVYSWQRMVKGGFGTRVSRSLQTIEALDAHTVRVRFAQPELGFVPFGGFAVLPKATIERVGDAEFKARPVGSGPYRFVALARGQYVDLERYDGWWGGKPEVQKARFQFVTDDNTRVARLKAGEADLSMQVPYPAVAEVQAAPGLKTAVLSPGGMTAFLALKTDNPKTPWADPRVREAIALAIDTRAIVKDILHGHPQHFPLLAPGDLGYDEGLKAHPHDPERARALLKDAGAEGLAFELPYIAGAATGLKETAEAVALYLGKVGIKATPKPLEGPQFIRWVLQSSRNPQQDYEALFIGAVAGTGETSGGLLTHFGSVTPFAWYANPQINGMALKMAGTADRDQRAEAIKALGRAAHEDRRYIPLWTSAHVYAMKRCIEFKPTLGAYDVLLLRDVKTSGCKTAAGAAKP